MESLVQRLGWRGSSSSSGYCPPGCSLLDPDSGDEEDTREQDEDEEEDRRLVTQLAKLDKSYQKFSIRDKQ
jgi:hypothetical protein